MKRALTVFFVTLITSASFAVSAGQNVYECMYNCGYEGLSMRTCKRICSVPP